MTEIIKDYLNQIQIGAEQSYKNLAVFPVLSDYVIPFDYLTLDEALCKLKHQLKTLGRASLLPLKIVFADSGEPPSPRPSKQYPYK